MFSFLSQRVQYWNREYNIVNIVLFLSNQVTDFRTLPININTLKLETLFICNSKEKRLRAVYCMAELKSIKIKLVKE